MIRKQFTLSQWRPVRLSVPIDPSMAADVNGASDLRLRR